MINRTVLVGRLTKEPELKYTQSGVAVCRFTLAVNRTFANQSGEREADFINVVTWRKQAENTANYLRKGSLAGIEGRIQTSSFDGQDGKRVFMTEVVADSVQFLEPRSSSDNGGSQPSSSGNTTGAAANSNGSGATNGPAYQSPSSNTQYGGPVSAGTAVGNDPFGGNPIEVSDDDLPF